MEDMKKIYIKRKIYSFFLVLFASVFLFFISKIPILADFGISVLIISVLFGAFVGNFHKRSLNLIKKSGILAVSTKQILRLGIILYGFKITFKDIAYVGFSGVFSAFLMVFFTIVFGYICALILKIDKKDAILMSSGSAICGAAAVLATQSVLKNSHSSTVMAVCLVVIFGTTGMFLYPFILNLLDFSPKSSGFMIGLSLHEVAQVVAASAGINAEASNIAIIIKMLRVLMLVPFLLALSLFSKDKFSIKNSIPWFAVYFLLVICFGSFVNLGQNLLNFINFIDTILLTMAMFALGLTLQKNIFKTEAKSAFILAFLLMIWLILAGLAFTFIVTSVL